MAISYLDLVEACDSFPYGREESDFYRLMLPDDSRPHGFIAPKTLKEIPWTANFQINRYPNEVRLVLPAGCSKDQYSSACNDAFAEMVQRAIDKGLVTQHSEPFAILGAKEPVQIERFAASLFGIVHRGAHMTAYTESADGLKIWVPTRSMSIKISPGALDTTVAGGVRAGESPLECIVHESAEEASLPEDLVRKNAVPCGVLSYISWIRDGFEEGLVIPDILYTYDLRLDSDITPKPCDEEVKEFQFLTVAEVKVSRKPKEELLY